jgi:hypothetical protein
VRNISIPKIVGMRLHYEGPLESKTGTKNVELDMPLVTMLGVDIQSIAKDFTTNLMSVNAKLKSATADNFTVKLMETVGTTTKTKKFGADLSTGEIRANAMFRTTNPGKPDEATELESGGFQIDSIGLREITGRFSEFDKSKKRQARDQTLGYDSRFAENLPEGEKPGVDLNTVVFDKKSGVSVGSTAIRGVKYKDPNYGLTIDVQEALIPKTMNIPNKGPVTIPQAKITNAYFRIADVMALKKGGGGGGDDAPADEQYYNILDHVHGNFKSNIYCPIHLFDVSEDYEAVVRQQVFPLDVDISRGRFNYEKVEDNALWLRNDVFVSLQMDTDDLKTTWDGRVEPDMSKSYLALEVGGYNVLEWTPSGAGERNEMLDKQVKLKRIIRPDDHDSKAEKEKKAEKAKADKAAGKKGWIEPDEIELRNVNAKLGLRGYIPLDLGATGRIGIGTPGGDALTDLVLKSESTQKLLWSVKQAALTIEELNIGGTTLKGDRGKSATITINDIVDGSISFDDGKVMHPSTLEGTITDATVENLAVVLGE